MLTDSYNTFFDKNCMWIDHQTHDGFDVFSPYIESNSRKTVNMDTISMDDKSIKEELIQAATNRLRQRLLEQRFESFKTQVVELQSRLEMIKIDTSSSIKCMGAIDSLSEQQFDIFEKRLNAHKEELDLFLRRKHPRTVNVLSNNAKEQKTEKSVYTSSLGCLSKASFSSLSSMFLSQNSNLHEEDSEYDHLGSKPQLRRRKRQQLRHSYNNKSKRYSTDSNSDWSESIQEYQQQQQQQQQENKNNNDQMNISPFLLDLQSNSHRGEDLDFISVDTEDCVKDLPIHPYEYHVECNSLLSSARSRTSISWDDQEIGRNALDDALSFLNDLASDADDGGFREDIYNLLDLNHSFIPRSFESESRIPPPFSLSHNTPNKKLPNFILSAIDSCIYGSLKWCKFLFIMSIAIAITLRRGPSDMFYHTNFRHQMSMNKVW